MSALAIPSTPWSSAPEPMSDEKQIDDLFTQYEYDLPTHRLFVDGWGILKGKMVTDASKGVSGSVVKTRYASLVAKCYNKNGDSDSRAWREARTLVVLNREKIPHIPKVYAASPYRGGPILVFNNAGQDLLYSLGQRRLQLDDISIVAEQVLRCVQFLAERGITHNDIKPQNICYDKDRHFTTLVDWEGASSRGAPEQVCIVTKSFQPPENCLALPLVTDAERSKADVWAVAASIFVLLSNQFWIGPEAYSRLAILHAMQQRLTAIPQPLIDASPIKEQLFEDNRLRPCTLGVYRSAADALKTAKGGGNFTYNAARYARLTTLVLDLLKIVPAERPSAGEALANHFPPTLTILAEPRELPLIVNE